MIDEKTASRVLNLLHLAQ